tara:strand:- start:1928 stop:2980 length:1053 start_codon:yes stop_codon:yes gene_type:complete
MKKTTVANRRRGFSLIELMVAMGILSVLMLMLTLLLDQVQRSWTYSESRITQFREARVAFDLVTKNLGQASLNTYWDLKDEDEDGLIDKYYRTSELHFETMKADDAKLSVSGSQELVGHAVFFQAPLGFSTKYRNLNNLFNGRGYFVSFGSNEAFRPRKQFLDSIAPLYRYRLMEFRPPAESNQVFADGGAEREAGEPQDFTEWFKQGLTGVGTGDFESHLNPIAENIVTLIVLPRDSLEASSGGRDDTHSEIAPDYEYNSNDVANKDIAQQVPPLVRVTMVAIDEISAIRLADGGQRPEIVPKDLFQSSRDYKKDIDTLSAKLNEERINHKIFSSMVMLRSAKWSDAGN